MQCNTIVTNETVGSYRPVINESSILVWTFLLLECCGFKPFADDGLVIDKVETFHAIPTISRHQDGPCTRHVTLFEPHLHRASSS
jgi:hypothetical protein